MRTALLIAILGATLLPPTAAAQDQPQRPWKAGDPPPPLAGVRLADPRPRLDSLLGPPSAEDETGDLIDGEPVIELTYESKGLVIMVAARAGVRHILASAPGTELGGVRVGDAVDGVVKRWGDPDTGGLGALLYEAGTWMYGVQCDVSGRVAILAVGYRPDGTDEE